eukprot:scaffold499566_cov38-Prasinocladus_malaysianus.AAC.1
MLFVRRARFHIINADHWMGCRCHQRGFVEISSNKFEKGQWRALMALSTLHNVLDVYNTYTTLCDEAGGRIEHASDSALAS